MGSHLTRLRNDYVGLGAVSTAASPEVLPIEFNRSERRRLRSVWESIPDAQLFGETIFRRIFDEQPQLKAMFQWTEIPTAQLHANREFRIHAMNIVNVIDYCVDNVNHLQEKAGPKLRRLGSSHIRFQGFGMNASEWEIFRISILTTIQHQCEGDEDNDKNDLVETWDKLVTWIIRQMQFGFNGMKDRLDSEQTDFRTSMRIYERAEMNNANGFGTPSPNHGR